MEINLTEIEQWKSGVAVFMANDRLAKNSGFIPSVRAYDAALLDDDVFILRMINVYTQTGLLTVRVLTIGRNS